MKTMTAMTTALLLMTLSLAPLAATAQGGGGMAPPFAGGKPMTTEEALKQAPKLDPTLVPMDKAFYAAQTNLKKSPKDAKAKKTFVEAAYKYGHAVMLDQGKMSPKVQYRASLALLRKAVAVDPKHQPSLADIKTIEDIYKGMGMPSPK